MVAVGTQLGPYKILSRLGAGGMGEVYRAQDLRLGREVAIKVLPERFAKDSEALGRFEREARALAALSHPNILTIYDFGNDQGVSFAVMELLEGETLRACIERSTLTWDKALEIAIAIAEGLTAAHSKGVIHRDLKPENIFLTVDGVVKILDLGLARVESPALSQNQDSVSTMWAAETRPGTVLGTIPYMSPEQVRGDSADARSDIFSFGCVLYEMVAGSSPFSYNTAAETMAAILKDTPPRFSKSNKKILPELERVILRCLEKNREERFQSARDLTSALKMISSGSGFSRSLVQKEQGRKQRRARKSIDSLAVLPFANAGSDPNTEYLSDGITESIINSLSQFPKLRVMARSTVFRYKGREVDPQEVGYELSVRAVLTGRVVQRGDNLSIQTELVDVADGSQLWGEQYNRKLSDILAVQEEISNQISEKLRIRLTGEEQKRLKKRHTENTEAYQLYLKGRYYWNKRTEEGLKKGVEYFQQAIDLDPNYALAYAGLADSYNLLGSYEILPLNEAFLKGKAAAMRALGIDGTLAEAHTSLAYAKYRFDWDWSGAEREFKRAIEFNPNYATAHHWYGGYLAAMGRLDEAMAEMKRAQELDPLSLIINSAVGMAYYFARQYDQAIERYRKTLEMDPNFAQTHFDLLLAYIKKGMHEEAIAETQKAMILSGEREFAAAIGHAYATSGYRGAWQKWLEESEEESKRGHVSPYRIAIIYANLGEKDRAFEWLQKAYEEHSEGLVLLKIDPMLDSLRSDPRFVELLQLLAFAQ